MPILIWGSRTQFQTGVLLLLVLLAFWRGAAPERRLGVIFVLMVAADQLYHQFLPAGVLIGKINLGHFAIDLTATLVITWIALRANRVYPIFLGAFQLAAAISHFVVGLNPSLGLGAYIILAIAPSYLQIVGYAVGLWCHIRRVGRYGQYPSWQSC